MEPGIVALIVISFVAAFVNGALGYGFSSITVPVGLLYFTNRVLNPALVLVEVGANLYTVFLNRQSIGRIWKRVITIVIGLIPAILLGSYFLKSMDPSGVKLVTYCA